MLTYWFSLIEKAWKRYSLHRFIFLYIYTHINVYIYTVYIKIIYIYTYIIYNRFTGYKSTRSLYFPVYVHYMGNSSMAIKSWEDIPFNPLTNPDWFGCNFPLSWENDGNIAFKTIKPISTRRIWVPSHPLSGLCSSKVPGYSRDALEKTRKNDVGLGCDPLPRWYIVNIKHLDLVPINGKLRTYPTMIFWGVQYEAMGFHVDLITKFTGMYHAHMVTSTSIYWSLD